MLKKSTSWANKSAIWTTEGTSTIIPTWIRSAMPVSTRASANRPGAAQFFQRGNHREHDPDIMPDCRTGDGAQLIFEKPGTIQADSDSAPPQEWIFLLAKVHIGGRFVPSNIERTYDYRSIPHNLQDRPVGSVLLLFRWKCRAFHVKEFRPEQANALSTVDQGVLSVFDAADIGHNFNMSSIPRDGRKRGVDEQGPLPACFQIHPLLILPDRCFFRVENYFPPAAIQDDHVGIPQPRAAPQAPRRWPAVRGCAPGLRYGMWCCPRWSQNQAAWLDPIDRSVRG